MEIIKDNEVNKSNVEINDDRNRKEETTVYNNYLQNIEVKGTENIVDTANNINDPPIILEKILDNDTINDENEAENEEPIYNYKLR